MTKASVDHRRKQWREEGKSEESVKARACAWFDSVLILHDVFCDEHLSQNVRRHKNMDYRV
jgi:hypothetical protein